MRLPRPQFYLRTTVAIAVLSFVTSGVALTSALKLGSDLTSSYTKSRDAWLTVGHMVREPQITMTGTGSGESVFEAKPFVGELQGER